MWKSTQVRRSCDMQKNESKTESTWFFLCFRAIRMTGEKVPDKDIHISLEVFHQFKIICLQIKLQSYFSICIKMSLLLRTSRRSTSLQDKIRSLKISRMISRYYWDFSVKVIYSIFWSFLPHQLQARQNEIVTLTDAANDVEELALTMDDDEKVTNWGWSSGTKRRIHRKLLDSISWHSENMEL